MVTLPIECGCQFFLEHFFTWGGPKKNCALGLNFIKSDPENEYKNMLDIGIQDFMKLT